jgi:signal transduction histidine kinase
VNQALAKAHDLAIHIVGSEVQLVFEPDPNAGLADVDDSRLQVAVLGLLFNARDALPEGGRIVLRSCAIQLDDRAARPLGLRAGAYVQISVTDNGTGMTPDVLERAINPFFTTKPIGQGIGLGLSTVHGFAQQSGGTTTLHSAPGTGTEVRVLIPVASSNRGHA